MEFMKTPLKAWMPITGYELYWGGSPTQSDVVQTTDGTLYTIERVVTYDNEKEMMLVHLAPIRTVYFEGQMPPDTLPD